MAIDNTRPEAPGPGFIPRNDTPTTPIKPPTGFETGPDGSAYDPTQWQWDESKGGYTATPKNPLVGGGTGGSTNPPNPGTQTPNPNTNTQDFSGIAGGINQHTSSVGGAVLGGVNQGLSLLGQNQQAGFDNVNQNLLGGFNTAQTAISGLGNKLEGGISGLTGLLNSSGEQAASNHTALTGNLSQIKSNQDTYYEDLAGRSDSISGGIADMQTGLTDYYDQYGKDVNALREGNARLESGIQGGIQGLQRAYATQQGATPASLVNGVAGGQVQQTQTQNTISNAARGIYTNQPVTSQNDIQARQQFVTKLNMARNASGQNPQLGLIASAFDNNGRLIADNVDPQGMRIARAIDGQGNLVTARLDQQGQIVAQEALNIDQILGQIQSSPY